MQKQTPFDQIKKTVYEKTENIVSRAILDETILVPIAGNLADMQYIFSTETVGAFIWDQINGANDLAAISRLIHDEFTVGPDRAVSDLQEFVGELHDAGLIQVMEN